MTALGTPTEASRARWERLAGILTRVHQHGLHNLDGRDLADLGRLYRSVSADLAYARTRQLAPDLIAYLNGLVGQAHAYVYMPPAGHLRRIPFFFRRTFPAVLQRRIGFVLLAASIMAAGAGLGLGLEMLAPAAVEAVAPKGLGEELLQRFETGTWFNDPLAARPLLSAAIMANNIRVAVIAFAGGILCGLLTLYALYGNGVILGVLTGVFIRHRHGLDFWAAILPHGVAELTAVCVAGGAGLLLGSALIDPGPYRRRDALVLRGREALVLFLGVVAMLILAGVIEGFVSTIGALGNRPRLAVAAATGLPLYLYLFWPRRRAPRIGKSPGGGGKVA